MGEKSDIIIIHSAQTERKYACVCVSVSCVCGSNRLKGRGRKCDLKQVVRFSIPMAHIPEFGPRWLWFLPANSDAMENDGKRKLTAETLTDREGPGWSGSHAIEPEEAAARGCGLLVCLAMAAD
ncbi:Transcription factor 25 [Anopheles sinensis]|uniref:Transcription factor 25 n=1 Tax=Anopheles sinensis TaxID=74873 RepID=A0A084W6X8_ANOSI|nr:Transcription factor 25 [Anopheles sinensis]